MSPPPTPATRFAVVAVGAVGGALLRAGISELIPLDDSHFPTALLLTQAIGCGLAGLLTPTLLRRGPLWSLGFLTGALGSFTTFGLFTGEILLLAPEHLVTAIVYLLAAVLVGVSAAWAGVAVAMGDLPSREHLTRLSRPGSGDGRDARQGPSGYQHPIRSRDRGQAASPVQHERRRWRR
ncbi:fluoride efflux transporter FluC [Arsenicicoccus sp. oral taxon 190]|uniref:fluoride efflux transporter FluC n=1 Tax=Arsenicicoccus sp. oral taxon 190 TaxID=1658671 RepID=UPI0012E171A8|nr:CrcB family protein [Arsenicicoccus sp. oral taxon 190]